MVPAGGNFCLSTTTAGRPAGRLAGRLAVQLARSARGRRKASVVLAVEVYARVPVLRVPWVALLFIPYSSAPKPPGLGTTWEGGHAGPSSEFRLQAE